MQAEPPAMLTPDSGIGKFFANFGTPTPADGSGSPTTPHQQQTPSAGGAAAATASKDPVPAAAANSRKSCYNSRASISDGGDRPRRKASVSALVVKSSYDDSGKAKVRKTA